MIFHLYLQDFTLTVFDSTQQRTAWLKLVHKFVSMAQQKIFNVVQGYKQNRDVNIEHLEQLHVVFQKGQVLHQHDINAPGRQGSSLRAGESAGTAPCHTIPLWEERGAAGALGAQRLHGKHQCNCPAEVKAAACTALPEGWTGTSVEGCPLLCPSTLSAGYIMAFPTAIKKAGFYFDFSLYFKHCDKMISQQQGMQCAIIMNTAGPQNWVGTQATSQMLAYNLLLEKLHWQILTL